MEESRLIVKDCHSLNGIDEEVQQDLLQLYAIRQHERKRLRKSQLDSDPIPGELTAGQIDRFMNHLIHVDRDHLCRLLLQEGANPRNNGARAGSV